MDSLERAAEAERFSQAVLENGKAMFRVARAILDSDADAEDAVGEAVLSAWENWARLRDPGAVRPWLLRIAANSAYGLRRKHGRVTAVEDMTDLMGSSVDRPYEDLWEAVEALPRDYRAVIVLFYYEDMTVEEIARTLGLAKGTVKSRLNRARGRLKCLLAEEGEL